MPMEATFEKLAKIIFEKMIPKLENNIGLAIFAKERAKFEGWLKVELCDSLLKHFSISTIVPEKDRIDITFGDWAIELKTVNTNYKYGKVENKPRPISMNIKGVIDDIEKLKSTNYTNKAVLFVVFPVTHDHEKWKTHLQKISNSLKELEHREFKFKNKIPGVIYFGLLQ